MITLKEILIAPFGRVRFKDFFMADVITSAGEPLKDVAFIIYYLKNTKVHHIDSGPGDTMGGKIYLAAVSLLPSWFRMAQCINKYYYTRMERHLLNCGKYFSTFWVSMIQLIWVGSNKMDNRLFALWVFFSVVQTLYKGTWDFIMDWGLFRSKDPKTFMLRP